jgi:colanic acid biosynthesis glycosyl transferase WcaI
MKILIVSQYFWPEEFRINDLAVELSGRKHEVTVLTGVPNYPSGSFFPGYSAFHPKEENYRGVRIIRVPLIPRKKGDRWQLVVNYCSFLLTSCLLGVPRLKKDFDVIFVFGTSPVTQVIPAILLKRIKQTQILFWVQDLWPESLSATGAIKSEIILSPVRILVRWIYKHSDRILIQSQAFYAPILKTGGVINECIEYLPNWTEAFYQPIQEVKNKQVLEDMPEGFRVVFAGNIGAAQSLGTILEAAEILRNQIKIQWVILGDGSRYQWLKNEVISKNLGNLVTLLGRRPTDMMPEYFAMSDVMLVTLNPEPIFGLTIPSKLQSYIACGRPIIGALDGEGARIIEEAKAGFSVPAGNASALAQAILTMNSLSKEQREKLGKNGLIYYQKHFEREKIIDKLERIMQSTQEER